MLPGRWPFLLQPRWCDSSWPMAMIFGGGGNPYTCPLKLSSTSTLAWTCRWQGLGLPPPLVDIVRLQELPPTTVCWGSASTWGSSIRASWWPKPYPLIIQAEMACPMRKPWLAMSLVAMMMSPLGSSISLEVVVVGTPSLLLGTLGWKPLSWWTSDVSIMDVVPSLEVSFLWRPIAACGCWCGNGGSWSGASLPTPYSSLVRKTLVVRCPVVVWWVLLQRLCFVNDRISIVEWCFHYFRHSPLRITPFGRHWMLVGGA
jgi:hypothetical protein